MPGLIEETGQTVRTVASGLVSTPALLVLVVFQSMILIGTMFLMHERNLRDTEVLRMFIAHCEQDARGK